MGEYIIKVIARGQRFRSKPPKPKGVRLTTGIKTSDRRLKPSKTPKPKTGRKPFKPENVYAPKRSFSKKTGVREHTRIIGGPKRRRLAEHTIRPIGYAAKEIPDQKHLDAVKKAQEGLKKAQQAKNPQKIKQAQKKLEELKKRGEKLKRTGLHKAFHKVLKRNAWRPKDIVQRTKNRLRDEIDSAWRQMSFDVSRFA